MINFYKNKGQLYYVPVYGVVNTPPEHQYGTGYTYYFTITNQLNNKTKIFSGYDEGRFQDYYDDDPSIVNDPSYNVDYCLFKFITCNSESEEILTGVTRPSLWVYDDYQGFNEFNVYVSDDINNLGTSLYSDILFVNGDVVYNDNNSY